MTPVNPGANAAQREGQRSARTQLGRRPERGHHDLATIESILKAASTCHVAWVADGTPRLLPTIYAMADGQLYLHGSSRSGLVRAALAGAEFCICVSLNDGLVLARSAMHHSMNYRAVVLFGGAREVTDEDEKTRALNAFVEHVLPCRSQETRAANHAEMTATAVVAVALAEASAKVRSGPPKDIAADMALPYWAGVVPTTTQYGRPIPAADLEAPLPLPASVTALLQEPYIELQRNGLRLSNDRQALNIDMICAFLQESAYWSKGVTRDALETAINNALCIGVYRGKQQLAFCRLVTDHSAVAYLCDVFVVREERGQGIERWMLETLRTLPELRAVQRWVLAADDAQGLYADRGWQPLANPALFLEHSGADSAVS